MKTILLEYWKILKLRKTQFFSLIGIIIIVNILEIIAPLFYKDFANAIAGEFSHAAELLAFAAIFSIIIVYCTEWVLWRIFEYLVIDVEAGSMRDLSNSTFTILQQQKYEFFQNEFSGSIVKKASRFVSGLEAIVDWVVFQAIGNFFLIISAIVIFAFQSPLFAFYFFIFSSVFLIFATSFYFYQFPFHSKSSEMDSKISGNYADSFSNIFTVKSSGKEIQEQYIVKKTADKWFTIKRIAWLHMFFGFGVQAILWISFEIFLNYQMLAEWKAGNFSVGDFILFNSIVLIVMRKLWDFGRSLRNLFGALSDSQEMAEIIDRNNIEKDSKDAEDFVIRKGKIEFKNLNFGYDIKNPEHKNDHVGASIHRDPEDSRLSDVCNTSLQVPENFQKKLLFQNFNLTISAGEKVALVGASGSGKTTITKLLFRFYDIHSGNILFDEKPISEITLHSLRSQISLVPQRPELFHRSIKENLLFAKPQATEDEITQALQKSRALDFVENLPEKSETMVGERGVKLSGGEAQRIAIARAFLEDSPIVVLDEATSALDSITEHQIQAGVFELIEKKTAIVIAHRLSTILKMNRIIVMENGAIYEEGTHEKLLEKNGKYAQMWKHQSGNFLRE